MMSGEGVLQLDGLSRLAAHADGDGSSHWLKDTGFKQNGLRSYESDRQNHGAIDARGEDVRLSTNFSAHGK
jgi:hypothetical protein